MVCASCVLNFLYKILIEIMYIYMHDFHADYKLLLASDEAVVNC